MMLVRSLGAISDAMRRFIYRGVSSRDMAIRRAQVTAFSKQMPLLYFGLMVNCGTLAFSHYGHAPSFLTVVVPLCFLAICTVRTIVWARTHDDVMSDEAVARRLKTVIRLGLGLGVSVLAWALSLYSYGNADMRSHVVLSVGVTVFACIFCLMHLRAAALLLTAALVIPFAGFLVLTGEPINIAMAINILLVAAAMVVILMIVSRDFEKMVNSQIETQRLSDENSRLAALDSLTGLPNRREFFQQLARRLRQSELSGEPLVVGVIDLDGFKPVNDLYGHAIGDRLLIMAGERLQDVLGETMFVARVGGDEFAVILSGAADEVGVLAAGERLCAALKTPYAMPGIVAKVSASVGFACSRAAGKTAQLLYERADYALYYAKHNRRGRPVMFSSEHETEMRSHSHIEQCLRKADLDAELSLDFQPLFDVDQNKVIAFEALARWRSPELGRVAPGVFIAVAERTDLMNKMTHTLLRKALQAARKWPDDIQVSFNLSMRDLISTESILHIITIVNNSGFDPRRIDFEVTETALMADFDQVQESIHALKALGARISLDDFGTGYSSLSYVHRLPLDKIKVDRSFVTGIETEKPSRDIVRAVVGLCRDLGINCVVEGMETEGQADTLRGLGCKAMQGYYFGKPMPEAAVLDLLANHCRNPAANAGSNVNLREVA